jgi:hypothetical protein
MPRISIGFGVVLIGLGVVGYLISDTRSVTALIPAFFGAALVGLGGLALNEKLRKHAMHVAVLVGLVGCVVPAYRAIGALQKAASGEEVQNWTPFTFQALMAVICAVFVALCVRSFIQARRSQAQRTSTP